MVIICSRINKMCFIIFQNLKIVKNADLFVSCPGAPDEMKEMIDSRRTYEAHWLSLQKQA